MAVTLGNAEYTRPMTVLVQPILRYFWRSPVLRRRSILCIALALAASMTEITVAVTLLPLLASLGVDSGPDLAGFIGRLPPFSWLLLFATAMMLRAAVNWMSAVEEERGAQELTVSLQARLFTALARAHWDVVRRVTPPTITSALQTQSYDASYAFGGLVRILSSALLAVGYLVSTALLFPVLLPLLVVLLAAMWRINARRNRSVLTRAEDYHAAQTELHQHYEDWVAISRIASLGIRTDKLTDRFEQSARLAASHSIAYSRTAAATGLSYQLAVLAAVLIGLPVAWWLETPPALLAFGIVSIARVLPRAASIQAGYQGLINAVAPLQAIETLVDRLTRDAIAIPAPDHSLSWQQLELTGVGIKEAPANGKDRWILRDVDLQLKHGEWLAVIGETGGGKTTLAEVMLALIRPDAGEVRLDGLTMDDEMANRWRSQAAYVPQDVILFDASIRDNLRLYAPQADDRELQTALGRAAAGFVTARLPEGLDTRAGPGGRWLSGGERQRIGIARALLRNPGLLVLDEPSAALDQETEGQLMDALAALDHTMSVVLITHRPELQGLADRVIQVDDGRLITP